MGQTMERLTFTYPRALLMRITGKVLPASWSGLNGYPFTNTPTSPNVVSIQSSFIAGSEVGDACDAESFEECPL